MSSIILSPVHDENEENLAKILSPSPLHTCSQKSTPSISQSNR